MMKFWPILILSLILWQCSSKVMVETPSLALPQSINSTSLKSNIKDREVLLPEKFWTAYEDPLLNELVESALKNNEDMLIAEARIEQAREMVKFVWAERFPFLGYGVSINRQRTSEQALNPRPGLTYTTYQLNLNVQYELDLFGRLSSSELASIHRYNATLWQKEALKLTLVSLVMNTYFELISKERQIEIAKEQVKTLWGIYEQRKMEYELGLRDNQAMLQAKAELEGYQQTVEGLNQERGLLANLLALLSGKSPEEMFLSRIKTSPTYPKPLQLPALLSSEVLERRPDLKASMEELRATAYEVAQAKADYFPRINLTGNLGYQSVELANLFKGGATFWNLAGLLAGPILDFGKRESQVKMREAKQREALLNYVKTVRTAFKEVYDALIQLEILEKRMAELKRRIATLKELLEVVEARYQLGLVRYLEVLDAQRAYLSAQLDLEKLRSDFFKAQVYFIKAIGGGFTQNS